MIRTSLLTIVATLLANSLWAEPIPQLVSRAEFEAIEQRFADLERHVLQQSALPVTHEQRTSPGAVFGAEVTFLKVYQSEGEAPGFDLEAAPRIWAGFVGQNGIGIRARWFEYDAFNPDNVGVPPFIESIHLTVFDVEVTGQFKLGGWDGVISGGVRYADYEEFGFFDFETMNDSLGPVIGIQMRRSLNEWLSLFGQARASFQFAGDGLDNGTPMSNLYFNIFEVQLGAEINLVDVCGGRVFLRGTFETQQWSGGVIGDGDTEDIGLIGGAVAVGFSR